MAKKPSPSGQGEAERPPASSDVGALRGMTREDRLALLMKDLDATCGPLPGRRRAFGQTQQKPRRKT